MLRADERVVEVGGVQYTVTSCTARLKLAGKDDLAAFPLVQAKASEEFFWQDGINPDLVWCQFILDTEGDNKNWDYNPRPVLMKHFATAALKPVDMEHIIKEESSLVWMDKNNPPVKNTVFGVMAKSALADSTGTLLTDKQVAALAKSDDAFRSAEDKLSVVGWACMWNFLFPKTVKDVVATASEGNMAVSMERWISKYDFLYWDEAGETLKSISRADAEENGYADKWATRKFVNSKPIWRRSLAFTYGGVASTTNPANKVAQFLSQPELEKAAANLQPTVLRKLIDRHDELHHQFAITLAEDQRQALAAEHLWIHKCLTAFGR